VCKAFSANADFVMLGGMLAGTDECEGEWECIGDKKFLKFYGMSSQEAQDKHGLGLKDYRSSEGRVLRAVHKGPVADTVQDILGGIRSCCAYIGATSIKDMAKCAEFIRVNRTHFDQST
jgi:GMP reductase